MNASVFQQVGSATVEVGTFAFQGKEFSALGSHIDLEQGLVIGYPICNEEGNYRLTTWGGAEIASLTKTGSWLNRNVFGGFPVRMLSWSGIINGKKYHGRNSGLGMLLRMHATNS